MLLAIRKLPLALLAVLLLIGALAFVSVPSAYSASGDTLASVTNGATDTYVVPAGVSRIQIIASGGTGADGGGSDGGRGGCGGAVIAKYDVKQGDEIVINASTSAENEFGGVSPGRGNGGDGGAHEVAGGGGGGASSVLINDEVYVVAAGGGGGGFGFDGYQGGNGGDADSAEGFNGGNGDGETGFGGAGASHGNGGAAGAIDAASGSNFDDVPAGAGGNGGANTDNPGGGGGAGYSGGGGGSEGNAGGGGGGAGSSYAHPDDTHASLYMNDDPNDEGICLSGNLVMLIDQSPEPEDDGDGANEIGLPNNGDANGDGIQDSEQNTVVSFPNPEASSFTSVEVSSGCLTSGSMSKEIELSQADGAYDYPVGLADFTVGCLSDGDTITVELYFYGTGKTASAFVPRKFTAYNGQYQTLAGAIVEDVTIGGESVVKLTYSLVDGGQLDNDQQVNGEIVDPAGLALAPTSGTLPATGNHPLTTQIWLALGLLSVGVLLARLRRRRLLRS